MGAASKLQSPPSSNEYFMENTMQVAIIGIELNQPKTNPLRHGSTSLKLLRKSSTGPDAGHGTTRSAPRPSNNDAPTYANMSLCKLDFQITIENSTVLVFVLALQSSNSFVDCIARPWLGPMSSQNQIAWCC